MSSTGSDMEPHLADPDERWKLLEPSLHRTMFVGCISAAPASRLGPGWVRNEMIARPLVAAECPMRGRLSENRCIHSRCRSILMISAANRPRPVTATSAFVARMAAA